MKPKFSGLVVIVAVVIGLMVIYSSAFIVNPKTQALVLQFGRVTATVTEPGLNFKVPLMQNVEYLPKTILDLEQGGQEVIAADQKRLIVSAFARYRIVNPVAFYQTVRTQAAGDQRLQTFMSSALRAVLADASFTNIVRDDRAKLMERIKVEMDKRARELGVEVVDVRIRRADLPDQNSRAIYARMQTERQREATEIRSKGSAESQRITAQAEGEKTITLAQATRDANIRSGEGEAQRAGIFAEAYGKDPEFFAFYRSLSAYETAFTPGTTRLVISPKSDFFRYFSDPQGKTPAGGPPILPAVPAKAGAEAPPASTTPPVQ
jgi:membrane protease subunit HflC